MLQSDRTLMIHSDRLGYTSYTVLEECPGNWTKA